MNPDMIPTFPLGFQDWPPVMQAAALGLMTFVQEDVPAVSGALLVAAGGLPWSIGFLGVFLGIWGGDALLYLLARWFGRPWLERPWVRRFLSPGAVSRSERWFGERGSWLLVSSRFLPGTRLPTYVAAGLLGLPFGRFLLVTGLAVLVWVGGIFLLAKVTGPGLLQGLRWWGDGGWIWLVPIGGWILVARLASRFVTADGRRRLTLGWERWWRWEFWPAWLFYLPVAANYVRLAAKYGGFTVPTAANPGIFSGGFVGESKMATLRGLMATAPEFTAAARLLPAGTADERLALLKQTLCDQGIDNPFILKPDVGQRGAGVKLIRSIDQAADYLARTTAPLVVQRYAPGPGEVGIFYYRWPHKACGRIFAITEKIFPSVTGDGRRTVAEFVRQDSRARMIAEIYLRRFGERAGEVLAEGETLRLVEAGNHAQGCIFRDGSPLWSEALERRIDDISRGLDGFCIGRFDIRYSSVEDLRAGRNFQIVELNGAAAEATSIYDSRNSLRAAYRTLFRQWELVFAIGAANRRGGVVPTRLVDLWRAWRRTGALMATYPCAD